MFHVSKSCSVMLYQFSICIMVKVWLCECSTFVADIQEEDSEEQLWITVKSFIK